VTFDPNNPYAPPPPGGNVPQSLPDEPGVPIGYVPQPGEYVVLEPGEVAAPQPMPDAPVAQPDGQPPTYGALVPPGAPAPVVTESEPTTGSAGDKPGPHRHHTGGSNVWAIAALASAIISFSLPAIALAIMGLRRAKQLGGRGRGLSIAALIIGSAWLLFGIWALAFGHYTPANLPGLGGGGGTPAAVSTGQCVNLENEGATQADLTVVTCAEPHQGEVVGVSPVRDGNGNPTWSFPGAAAVAEQAENFCVLEFTNYVGANLEASEFNMRVIAPTDETWRGGARTIVCYATSMDGTPLPAGTIRNSAR
jgi:hypothetical protein